LTYDANVLTEYAESPLPSNHTEHYGAEERAASSVLPDERETFVRVVQHAEQSDHDNSSAKSTPHCLDDAKNGFRFVR